MMRRGLCGASLGPGIAPPRSMSSVTCWPTATAGLRGASSLGSSGRASAEAVPGQPSPARQHTSRRSRDGPAAPAVSARAWPHRAGRTGYRCPSRGGGRRRVQRVLAAEAPALCARGVPQRAAGASLTGGAAQGRPWPLSGRRLRRAARGSVRSRSAPPTDRSARRPRSPPSRTCCSAISTACTSRLTSACRSCWRSSAGSRPRSPSAAAACDASGDVGAVS